MYETQVRSLSQEEPPEEGMATHSNILAWRIPQTEKPGRPQSMGSQRGMTEATYTHTHTHTHTVRETQGDGWSGRIFTRMLIEITLA